MTYLVERLAELRRHLDHLQDLRPRVTDRFAIERDLSLHNDVLFSLLMIAQLVVDIIATAQRICARGAFLSSSTAPVVCRRVIWMGASSCHRTI
jgi:hypothetical protein